MNDFFDILETTKDNPLVYKIMVINTDNLPTELMTNIELLNELGI